MGQVQTTLPPIVEIPEEVNKILTPPVKPNFTEKEHEELNVSEG